MTDDFPGHDPKTLWKEQEPEADPVTLEQIHHLARRLDRRARLPLLLAPPVLIAMAFIGGQQWQMQRDPLVRAMWAADILGMLLSFYLAARVLFPARDPSEPAGLYLRRRLRRLLANVRGGWMIAVVPLLPGMILGLYLSIGRGGFGQSATGAFERFLPLGVLAAATVFMLFRTRSAGLAIEAQLDEVTRLLKD